jgi:hypothetical protein
MDVGMKNLDFLEVFQAGELKVEPWYQLLNAGFEIKGIAGSDFPAHYGRRGLRGRYIPLLGPERTLVRVKPGLSAYEAWAEGIRRGQVVVSNGPIVRLEVNGRTALASSRFFRPLTRLEIVADGRPVATTTGDGVQTNLTVSAHIPESTVWVAARALGTKEADEPVIQAHTNPYFLRQAVADPAARAGLADRWEKEITFYKTQQAVLFPESRQREMFFRDAEAALSTLRQ